MADWEAQYEKDLATIEMLAHIAPSGKPVDTGEEIRRCIFPKLEGASAKFDVEVR